MLINLDFDGVFVDSLSQPVEHFTRAAAKEFGACGISANNAAPGPMDTLFFSPAETPYMVTNHKAQHMNGELTKIEDIVPMVKSLATDSWWVTVQTIFAHGGHTTRQGTPHSGSRDAPHALQVSFTGTPARISRGMSLCAF